MDESQTLGGGQLVSVLARGLQGVAVQHHLGTEAARALNLHAWGEARHDDHGANAQALRVVGQPLGMVARAHRHHALRALGLAQLGQFVARAALLERGGELQVFKLQKNLGPNHLRERLRGYTGSLQHLALQAFGGGFDGGKAEHGEAPGVVKKAG